MAPFWKLPESYVRERSRRNLLSNVLLFLRIVFIAGAVGLSLWLIVQRTRKRELRWGNIMRVAVPVAALGLLGAISDAPLALRNYDTAMPLETFRAVMIAGIVIGALGLFLGMACCAGLLFAVRPESLAALKPAHRRAVLADSLIALAVAAALATLLSQCEWFVIDRFHAQAVLSAGSPDIFGTISPAVSATAGAFESAIFELALLAFIGYAAGLLARRRWQTGVLALAGIAAFVPSQVHTAAEFALHYAILLATAGAIWLFVRGFAGGNALAYLLAVLTLGLGRRALMLLEQPYDGFRTQGWLVLVLLVMIVGWVVKPALSSARD